VQIDILVFDGFDELDALAPYEVLQNAAAAGADFSVRIVTWSGQQEVVAAHGLTIRVPETSASNARPDLVIVPGGGWNARSPQGARAEAERGEVPARIKQLHEQRTTIAAVCTGAMLLAEAGLLQGRPAITHHLAIDDLRAAGAEIVDARVVDDGDVITAGGVTSGLDLALWLVERFAGATIATKVADELEYSRSGFVWQHSIARP
jgi:transcriptional regulator GlxA family with amidase domain